MPGGFNLGLVMRQCIGIGKPQAPAGPARAALAVLIAVWARLEAIGDVRDLRPVDDARLLLARHRFELLPVAS